MTLMLRSAGKPCKHQYLKPLCCSVSLLTTQSKPRRTGRQPSPAEKSSLYQTKLMSVEHKIWRKEDTEELCANTWIENLRVQKDNKLLFCVLHWWPTTRRFRLSRQVIVGLWSWFLRNQDSTLCIFVSPNRTHEFPDSTKSASNMFQVLSLCVASRDGDTRSPSPFIELCLSEQLIKVAALILD